MGKKYYINACTVHKVKEVENIFECDDEYILYNPYKHYWITINSSGCEIIDAVKKYGSYSKIKSYFEEKYKSDDGFDFHDDVEPFLEYLVQRNFISNEKLEPPQWTKIRPDSKDIKRYKFNDIYISINDACNLNCLYCFNKANRHKRIEKENRQKLSVSKICSILQEFKELGGNTVVLTGGEPTLADNFLELLYEVSKIGLKVHIITNGTTLSRLPISEFINYVDVINISIDSLVSEEAAILYGKKDGKEILDNLFDGLRRLREAVNREKVLTKIRIMPVVTKINFKSMTGLVHELNDFFNGKLGWKFTMYGDIGIPEIDDKLRIGEKEYYYLLFDLAKEIDINENITAQQAYAVNYGNTRKLLPYPRTSTCAPSFLITETGDVYPCQGLECEENYLGSVYENSLQDLFLCDRFVDIREKLIMSEANECFLCELKYVCTERCSICKVENNCREGCKDAVIRRMYYKVKGF